MNKQDDTINIKIDGLTLAADGARDYARLRTERTVADYGNLRTRALDIKRRAQALATVARAAQVKACEAQGHDMSITGTRRESCSRCNLSRRTPEPPMMPDADKLAKAVPA
jgi:hypothetical protein